MIGKTVSHYKIVDQLGVGGMGVVYEALDTKLNRPVALKFLPPDSTVDSDAKKRFLQEAQAASALDHPNICTIHEISEHEGRMFIAMARYDGESLKDRIDRGTLPGEEIVEITRQIAEGMNKAHQNGIFHRDLKPANIIITSDGTVKIVDFGLAVSVGATRLTRTGTSLGTLAYMSPEQVSGQEVTNSSDIWALGVMIYEMMVGRTPFEADFEAGIVYGIAHRDPEPPVLENTEKGSESLAAGLQSICGRALEKNPDQRYGSFIELLDDLGSLGAGSPSTPTGPSGFQETPSKRFKTLLIGTGILAILFIAISQWMLHGPESDSQAKYQSVAVLPLRDVSLEGPSEQLSAGVTDGILTGLARMHSISVISRRSAARAADSDLSIPEIAKNLGADVVLDGSFVRKGNRLKMTATLVDGASDRNIWVSEFERDIQDIYSLYNEVALAIANGIGVETTLQETVVMASARSVSPEALDDYLKARILWEQRKSGAIEASIDLYEGILESSPDFAEAWVGLAEAHIVISSYSQVGVGESYAEARRCALRAIELDPNLAGAWNVLSEIAYIHDFDYAESERLRKKSLENNPSSATAHQWYAEFLGAMGRHDEALAEIKIAQRLDPLSPLMMTIEGSLEFYARKYDEAVETLKQVTVAHPDFVLARVDLMSALAGAGRYEEAARECIKWQKAIPADEEFVQKLQKANEEGGWWGIQKAFSRGLLEKHRNGEFIQARTMASGYAVMGNTEKCLHWLKQSYDDRDIALLRLKVNPVFDGLREDPRFIEILKRINLVAEE